MSKQCPVCNTEYPDATTFCPSDGTPLPSVQDPFIGKVLEGKYLIESLIGSGGMGNVYRGKHKQIETDVAIKILHANLVSDAIAVERFRREARAALTVNHPNAIQVMDFGVTEDKTVYIVMELLEGISLQKILENDRTIPVEKTVALFKQVCAAVGAAHTKNVIHRDLKPDNIIILNYNTPAEHVKVLDFSIAKVLSSGDGGANLTAMGMVVGTPQYMSPEQAQGMELDTRADIYSLGVTLYHVLTGSLPFTAATSMALALKHIHALPRPLREVNPDLPPAIESVVMKAMAKRPEDRQQTAFELAEDLETAAKRRITSSMEIPLALATEAETRETVGQSSSTNTSSQPAATVTHFAPVAQTRPILPPTKTPLKQPAYYASTVEPAVTAPRRRGLIIGMAGIAVLAAAAAAFFWLKPPAGKDNNLLTNPYFQNMVWIEGNTFNMGRDPAKGVSLDETPAHPVTVGEFWIDAYEVTNQEYRKFVLAEKYISPETWQGTNYPPGTADMPVTGVSWDDTVAYCKWLTKESKTGHTFRLPTEAEWEYAARGTDGRSFPWGNVWSTNRTVSGESTVSQMVPVNSTTLAYDQSPFRIFGLAGNVTEWTGSDYSLYPGSKAELDTNCAGCKIMRGGNYLSPNTQITTTFRVWQPPSYKEKRVGFRIAADALYEDRKLMRRDAQ